MTDEGNWEGTTILSRVASDDELAPRVRPRPPTIGATLAARAARSWRRRGGGRSRRATTRRWRPGTGWRSRRFAEAAVALAARRRRPGRSATAAAAVGRPTTIVDGLLAADGSLGRSWKDGRASGNGVLEDYTHLADGLLALYEATFDERWFTTARALDGRVLDHFADPAGGFFDTSDDHETAGDPTEGRPGQRRAVRQRDGGDACSCVSHAGPARAATAPPPSVRCGTVVPFVARYPTGFAQWLVRHGSGARARSSRSPSSGRPDDAATPGAPRGDAAGYRPGQVAGRSPPSRRRRRSRCSQDRVAIDGRPTAYVCRGFACRLPVTTRRRFEPARPGIERCRGLFDAE